MSVVAAIPSVGTIFLNGLECGMPLTPSAIRPTYPTAYDGDASSKFVKNVVRNQKYSLLTFIPKCLYEQFRFFLNFYFLLIAVSQFFPLLQIGYLFTYVAPLVFVLVVSMAKEAIDDIQRYYRDRDVNNEPYFRICPLSTLQCKRNQNAVNSVIALDKEHAMTDSIDKTANNGLSLRCSDSAIESVRRDLLANYATTNHSVVFNSKDLVRSEWLWLEGTNEQGLSVPGCDGT